MVPGRPDIPWTKLGAGAELLARLVPPRTPPVLLLSLPRSGSSWVGEMLGYPRSALYLREPVTQAARRAGMQEGAVAYVDPAAPSPIHRLAAARAFHGVPRFRGNTVPFPRRWGMRTRPRKRVIIKEVNPLAAEWLIGTYRPRVILLTRHPAAVAASYHGLGWNGVRPRETFIRHERLRHDRLAPWAEELAGVEDFWEYEGLRQGALLYLADRATALASDVLWTSYERLCAHPRQEFRRLADFSGIHWGRSAEKHLAEKGQVSDGRHFGTSRNTSSMPDRWKQRVADAELRRLRNAYWRFPLPCYQNTGDWQKD